MVEKNRRGAYFPLPPHMIGLKDFVFNGLKFRSKGKCDILNCNP